MNQNDWIMQNKENLSRVTDFCRITHVFFGTNILIFSDIIVTYYFVSVAYLWNEWVYFVELDYICVFITVLFRSMFY